ncbi:hypothetical protein [Halorhabdus sp. BNX81]|nr:hypothetical protein [Halorhabdus sp. BNX81]
MTRRRALSVSSTTEIPSSIFALAEYHNVVLASSLATGLSYARDSAAL